MPLTDINFGNWMSISDMELVIDRHIDTEDIHCVPRDRIANADAKKFYDEIIPIFCLAKDYEASEVFYVDDNEPNNNFDGKIRIKGTIISVECTKAISTEDAVSQSKITKLCENQGYFGTYGCSIPLDVFKIKVSKIIQDAVEKKIKKSQEQSRKYEGFHLIVTLDDTYFRFCNKNDIITGIRDYFTLEDIFPFQKVLLYWKTYTGKPEKIIEIE